MDTATIILALALAVSEALSMFPKVKANGIFQTGWNLLKIMGGKPSPKPPTPTI